MADGEGGTEFDEVRAELGQAADVPGGEQLRAHARAGGRVLHPCARSETTVAPLADWEKWTGMRFPESGEYILPDGMTPLAIDTARGVGTYVEPNVWVHHDLRGTG